MSERTVMIVEDQPDVAEMLAEMMRVSGFHVVTCYSSTAAINQILSQRPDIVLLDLMMPDISGFEVLRFIRSQEQAAHLPVILISAMSAPLDIRTVMAAGASAYLPKPVGFHELINTVQRLTTAG